MGVSLNKKNLIKKSNIGIKINTKSAQDKTSESADSQLDETHNTTSISDTTDIVSKSTNVSNSLSLLGAYSSSGDSD